MMDRRLVLLAALTLGPLVSTSVAAQICRGAAPDKTGWVAVSYGRAAGAANVFGADIAWRSDRGLLVFGDARRTAYEKPDPARDHLALGVGSDLWNSDRVGLCPSVAIEHERIEDLRVQRYPIGVALGWRRPLSGVERHLGLMIEPRYVYQREQIERFKHRSQYVSGRAGVVFGVRRFVTGLTFEHAFDDDARWNARARVGFTFK